MFKNQLGQINVAWIVGIGATTVIALTGSILGLSNIFNSKVDAVKVDVSANSERTAKLEEAINTIKSDNAIMKQDLKNILQLLK